MDVIASPIVTVVMNLMASLLVARGVLDSHSAVAFVQLGNNAIASIMTLGIAIYSIYKMVELKKHQQTLTAKIAATPVVSVKIDAPQPTSMGQSGLPTPESATVS